MSPLDHPRGALLHDEEAKMTSAQSDGGEKVELATHYGLAMTEYSSAARNHAPNTLVTRNRYLQKQKMTRRVYFIAHGGTVQGVGFRYFTRKRAQAYGLTGWCRNTSDNNVEGEAQGEDASVDKLLKDVDQGPSGASVVKLTQEERDVVADEAEFAVRH